MTGVASNSSSLFGLEFLACICLSQNRSNSNKPHEICHGIYFHDDAPSLRSTHDISLQFWPLHVMSHLLRLPRELRDEIYRLVFGQQIIHVQTEQISAPGTQRHEAETIESLLFHRCKESIDERDFSRILQSPPFNQQPHQQCPICEKHSNCWCVNIAEKLFEWDECGLPLIYVSRSVREEALEVLFAFTMFSFKTFHDLKTFVDRLPPARMSLVHFIHLDIEETTFFSERIYKDYQFVSVMKLLIGLRKLHLTVCPDFYVYEDFQTQFAQLEKWNLLQRRDTMVHFRYLSATYAPTFLNDRIRVESGISPGWVVCREWQLQRTWPEDHKARFTQLVNEKLATMS